LGTRTDQALRCADGEAHAYVEDDGQEVRDGVGDGGGQTEQASERKNLQVQDATQVLAQVEGLGNNIVAILLDPGADESSFSLAQERQRRLGAFGCKLGEVDDRDAADEADDDGDEALHDEDPAPACDAGHDTAGCGGVSFCRPVVLAVGRSEIAEAIHVPKSVGKNTGECRAHATNEVEHGIALLELVARVPTREEISAALSEALA
jgi:hypothetical protein